MNVACLTPFSQGRKMTTELCVGESTYCNAGSIEQRKILFLVQQESSIGNGAIISSLVVVLLLTDRNRSTQIFQQFKEGVASSSKKGSISNKMETRRGTKTTLLLPKRQRLSKTSFVQDFQCIRIEHPPRNDSTENILEKILYMNMDLLTSLLPTTHRLKIIAQLSES